MAPVVPRKSKKNVGSSQLDANLSSAVQSQLPPRVTHKYEFIVFDPARANEASILCPNALHSLVWHTCIITCKLISETSFIQLLQ